MNDFQADIDAIGRIPSISSILDVVRQITGMRFAVIARVTPDRWISCDVRDGIELGLKPGDELDIEATLCNTIRETGKSIVVDNASTDPVYRDNAVLALYGLQSYIAFPIYLPDGRFFGTLCAVDTCPAKVSGDEITGMFKLFAELIAFHLVNNEKLILSEKNLAVTQASLAVSNARLQASDLKLTEANVNAELRDQFIAVLGHDLRNPLSAISGGVQILQRMDLNERGRKITMMMQDSAQRMSELIENVLDFARGRLGGGFVLDRDQANELEPLLRQVINELRTANPDRSIMFSFDLVESVNCDQRRIAQLFSNLLGNAFSYGASDQPIRVKALSRDGTFTLSICNGGKPISREAMGRLFNPYTRGQAGANQSGLGLGLYIASQIAKAHDGALTVTSDETETCFTLTMPNLHRTEARRIAV